MIKLKDVLLTACGHVAIMKNMFPVMIIDCKYNMWEGLSKDLLNREVVKIDTYNDKIRVWLKEEKKK